MLVRIGRDSDSDSEYGYDFEIRVVDSLGQGLASSSITITVFK